MRFDDESDQDIKVSNNAKQIAKKVICDAIKSKTGINLEGLADVLNDYHNKNVVMMITKKKLNMN